MSDDERLNYYLQVSSLLTNPSLILPTSEILKKAAVIRIFRITESKADEKLRDNKEILRLLLINLQEVTYDHWDFLNEQDLRNILLNISLSINSPCKYPFSDPEKILSFNLNADENKIEILVFTENEVCKFHLIKKSDIDKFCENAVRERYDFECVAEVSTAFCMRIYSKKEELNE